MKRILLIEPVWNRNSADGIRESTALRLLIEPVWNRNRRWLAPISRLPSF